MIKLYGHAHRTAANILKIRAALAEAGVDYGYEVIDLAKGEQRRPEYLAINPHGKVPVLVDGDFVLPESDAILWYLAEKFPAAAMLPSDTRGRARVKQWCDVASTSLYTASYEIYIHTSWAEPANRSAFVAERAHAALGRALGMLEGHLEGRTFVAVDAFSIADFAVAAVVHMLRTRNQIDAALHPNIAAHAERVGARSAWQKALADVP